MRLLGELPGIRVYEEMGTRFEVKAEVFTYTAVIGEALTLELEQATYRQLEEHIKREATKIGASLFAVPIRTRSQPFSVTDRRDTYKLVRFTIEWGYWPKEPIVAPKKTRPATQPVGETGPQGDVEEVQPKEES